MQQIQLSQGQVALVDDTDYPLCVDFKWCYRAERNGKQGYAVRHAKVDGQDRLVYLHRQVMQPPEGYEVIFLSHNRLDCRRENLRVVTTQEARQHHRVRSDSKSGIKGVRFNPEWNTYTAVTYRDGCCYTLGTFYRQEEAVAAYQQALHQENPQLHTAPMPADMPNHPPLSPKTNPDAG
jgi:hypothetical protein